MAKSSSSGSGCLAVMCALILIALAIYAIAFAACVAVGVGLWFLIRYTWRAFSAANPYSAVVKSLSGIPPMGRAAIAAVPCVVLSLVLMGCFINATTSSSSDEGSKTETTAEQASETTSSKGSSAVNSKEGQNDQASESSQSSASASKWWKMSVDEFISAFNSTAEVPFVEVERFTPGDKSSIYYRNEYRLEAWDDAEGVHGTAGDCSVDIVSYRDGVRMYAIGPSSSEISQLLDDALKVYAPNVPESERGAIVEKKAAGDEISSLSSLDNGLNGYANNRELMIERTGKSKY